MREEIRFHVNDVPYRLGGFAPETTLLNWLRAQGLTATKEGCAEGDCGACTVAVARPDRDGKLRYRPVNACLCFLAQIDGARIVTAEGVAGAAETRPVPSLLAESHATQCGYCTPGFVTAIYAAWQEDALGDREARLDAIAGNLCRCTGYRPIMAAMEALPEAPPPRSVPRPDRDGFTITGPDARRFFAPATLRDALALKAAHPQAWVLAGGTDLALLVTKAFKTPPAILWLGNIDTLQEIDATPERLRIGAGVTYGAVLPWLRRHLPDFAALVSRIGARQVRSLGTVAGNLATASPIGDSAPPLMALGADVDIDGPDGPRRLPVEDFITGYRQTALAAGELITALTLPRPAPNTEFRCYKLAKRIDQDIATVSAAIAAQITDGRVDTLRVAFGGVADRPVRAQGLEQALIGRPWDNDTLTAALPALEDDIDPISDLRGSADYRRHAAANLVRRFFWETTQHHLPLRLEAL